ncbi:30S ribosomal protein S30 [Minwuia thermotolerans]|uniref:30S ribosomal protein S30 n=1 Tax=Minwuia thermotolerans TaxID=2056226 RepID=A0A2M9FVE7_9PROT|nr:30S ribosomal protein S30 [Minwuia thermotolerans]
METPLEIAFHGMDHSDAVEARIRERADRLERHFDRIVSCRVVVEAPHRHGHQGKLYRVNIMIGVPGRELVVNRARPNSHAHEDVYVALRDAFDAADRLLEDHARKVRGDVKTHEPPLLGTVSQMYPDHGFAVDAERRQYYFHRNAVVGDYEKLEPGDEVRMVVVYGESPDGPQATTIEPTGRLGAGHREG